MSASAQEIRMPGKLSTTDSNQDLLIRNLLIKETQSGFTGLLNGQLKMTEESLEI